MKDLMGFINNEEKKQNATKEMQEEQNKIVQNKKPKDVKEKFKDIKEEFGSGIKFPRIYLDKELLELTHKINDEFIMKLKSDKKLTKEGLEDVLPEYIDSYVEVRKLKKDDIEEIKLFIINNIVEFGVISRIFQLAGAGLNDVIVNTKDYIDIIYNGLTVETPFTFRSEEELRKVIDKMLAENNRKIDEAHPIISSKLEDGSRVEVQIPPIAANGGSCVTIRKFNEIPLLIEMLIDSGQMDLRMAYYLIKLSKGKCNIVVSGGTSSGKTSFLNAVTRFINNTEQLMVIEDTKELQPQMPCHLVRSYEARMANEEGKGAVPLEYLLRTALRSSPRRIIVGECRGPEIVVMLNAMNTGHPGSMTTIHADNIKEALVRIENMYLEARPTSTTPFIRQQITSAVDVLIQLVRFPDGARKIIAISEVEKRMEDGSVIVTNDIFKFKRDENDLKHTKGEFEVLGTPGRTIEQMNMFGVDIDKRVFHPEFEVTKEMVIEELRKDAPTKICGWLPEFLEAFVSRDPNILDKWPNLNV